MLSADEIREGLYRFLVCADEFQTAYDGPLPHTMLIAPDGKVTYAYESPSPDEHVANTLAAVKALRTAH